MTKQTRCLNKDPHCRWIPIKSLPVINWLANNLHLFPIPSFISAAPNHPPPSSPASQEWQEFKVPLSHRWQCQSHSSVDPTTTIKEISHSCCSLLCKSSRERVWVRIKQRQAIKNVFLRRLPTVEKPPLLLPSIYIYSSTQESFCSDGGPCCDVSQDSHTLIPIGLTYTSDSI